MIMSGAPLCWGAEGRRVLSVAEWLRWCFFLSSASLEKQGPSSLEEGYSAHYTITIVIGNPKIAFLESRGLKSRHQEAQEAAQEAIKYYEQAREGDFGRF